MSLKKQAVNGIIWTFLQQFSVQIINFAVQIILARQLMPEDFGLIAMLIVFVNLGQMLMDGGMTTSLIRTETPNQSDYSTVFLTNLAISIVIYIIIFLAAPLIANFYNQILLKNLLRVFALTFVVRSFVAVHLAKLSKEMNFKTQMVLQIPATIIGSSVALFMAFNDYGVWSLVWLNLTQALVFSFQVWLFIKWKPSFKFNIDKFKYHFKFGYKMTLSGLLDTVYNDAYRIVIGKYFSPIFVGFYNQAETMRLFPVQQLGKVLGKVTYPLFSNIKDDIQLKVAYKQTVKLVFFIVVPMMMTLIATGSELFLLLFGNKWLPAVPYFQILAFASITTPLTSYNLNILKVKGRSDLFLRLEVIKKVIGFSVVFVIVSYGIMPLVISQMLMVHFFAYLNMRYCGKIINYPVKEQIEDCFGLYLIGGFTLILTFILKSFLININLGTILFFFILIFFYLVVYFALVILFERKTLLLLKKVLFG